MVQILKVKGVLLATLFLLLFSNSAVANGLDSLLKDQLITQIRQWVQQDYPSLDLSRLTINFKVESTVQRFPFNAVMVVINRPIGARVVGNTVLDVDITSATGEVISNRKIPVYVNAKVPIYRAARALTAREIVTVDDVIQDQMDLDKVSMNTLFEIGEIIQKEVVYGVAKGSLFTKRSIRDLPLIDRGSKVTIVINKGNLILKVAGTALDDGQKADIIRVRSDLGSKKVMKGKVVDSETVIYRD
jgi:flagella basal body P-ring formation protein FlgA